MKNVFMAMYFRSDYFISVAQSELLRQDSPQMLPCPCANSQSVWVGYDNIKTFQGM